MILVDTTVWTLALSGKKPKVQGKVYGLLEAGKVAGHELIALELLLAKGAREEFLTLYRCQPMAPTLTSSQVEGFAREHTLSGKGLGPVEIQLLGAAKAGGHQLWTEDPGLRAAAVELGLAYEPAD